GGRGVGVTDTRYGSPRGAYLRGIIATGFVLITLFVNGTTLRYLVLFLKLDQLSPIDQALRHQVLGIGLGEVRDRTSEVAEELGFSRAVSDTVISQLGRQVEEEEQANTFDTALGDRQRVTLALIVIANRERSILLDLFRIQGLSRPVMETLLRSAEAMVDGARLEGRFGYVRAMRRRLRPSLRFRLAQAIHHGFHFDQPLMSCMTERFEMLMISYFVSLSLIRFMRTRMEPTLGSRIGEIVGEVLERQRKLLNEALHTLRLHYQGYSEALEMRLLQQVSLRLEGEEYDSLLSESLISDELHRELHRDVERRRGHLGAPLVFDIKAGIEARMRALPVFHGLSDEVLHAIAPQFSIHFTSPGERLYRRGRRVRTVYFISAGLAETHFPEHDVRFGAGDVIGAEEALSRMPARAVTRSLQFGQFLTISTRRFRRLVAEYPDILANLDELTRERHTTERSGVALLPGDSAVVRASDDAIALATADLADALPESADRPDHQQGPSP
ncbi:MAG: cyclic nucleotide-binding domain-containing protein, partial [Gluconacetobacter sp.]